MAPQTHVQPSERPYSSRASLQAGPFTRHTPLESSASPVLSTDVPHHHADNSDIDLTPPTSSSGLSSQDKPVSFDQDRSLPSIGGIRSDTLHALTTRVLSSSPTEPNGSTKRTSGGQIKRSTAHESDAWKHGQQGSAGHSRSPSVLSNGSSVAELSQQLRTRLSYAMVKVQNGWEYNTLDEVESLASQHGTPRSSITATSAGSKRQAVESPREAMSSRLRRRGSSSASTQGLLALGRSLNDDAGAQGPRNSQQKAVGARADKYCLAPPAPIVASTARRRPHHTNPPPSNRHVPIKYPKPAELKPRTASQNAAMEADAVETLLFMASPGNSGHQPSSSAAGGGGLVSAAAGMSRPPSSLSSPLMSEFASQELSPSPRRRVAFTGLSPTMPAPVDLLSSSRFDEIDRLIDEMDDASTESGVEHIVEGAVKPKIRK